MVPCDTPVDRWWRPFDDISSRKILRSIFCVLRKQRVIFLAALAAHRKWLFFTPRHPWPLLLWLIGVLRLGFTLLWPWKWILKFPSSRDSAFENSRGKFSILKNSDARRSHPIVKTVCGPSADLQLSFEPTPSPLRLLVVTLFTSPHQLDEEKLRKFDLFCI